MILCTTMLALSPLLALAPVQPAEGPLLPAAQGLVAAQTDEVSDAEQLRRARALAASGNREEALRIYGRMLERSPGNADARLARGRTFAWMQRWQEAEGDLRAVVEQSPGYADAWSALGDLYLWSDRPGEAVKAYTRWIELAPNDPAAFTARGRAHRAGGNVEAERADAEAARLRGGDPLRVDHDTSSLAPRVAREEALAPPVYRWSTQIGASHTSFRPERDAWREQELSLRRHFSRGSVALEFLRAQRFGRHDTAWALDAYAPLWGRAYANLRYQRSPGLRLLADKAWRVEAFQAVGRGWELSASFDHLDFGSGTDIHGLSIGRYMGNVYARYKASRVDGSVSIGHRVLLRHYFAGNGDDYFEVNAGSGRQDQDAAFGSPVRTSNSSIGVSFVKYFHPQWGFKLGAAHARDVEGFDERRVSAVVYTRW